MTCNREFRGAEVPGGRLGFSLVTVFARGVGTNAGSTGWMNVVFEWSPRYWRFRAPAQPAARAAASGGLTKTWKEGLNNCWSANWSHAMIVRIPAFAVMPLESPSDQFLLQLKRTRRDFGITAAIVGAMAASASTGCHYQHII